MGRLRDELLDPWGPLLAGVLGGLSWAVGTPALVAVGVGAAVYAVKAAVGSITGGPHQTAGDGPAPPLPALGTPARTWIQRASDAVDALQRMAPSTPVSATDVAAGHTAEEAAVVLQAMRRLGGQVVAITSALSHADASGLDDEAAKLHAAAKADPQDTSAQQSAAAVTDRIAVRDRLRKALTELDGRLQSSALQLEGLVARVAEVRAAASSVGQVDPTSDDLAALTNEVEGLRVGLTDAERVAQQALGP